MKRIFYSIDNKLLKICQHAVYLQSMQNLIERFLPQECAQHCKVCNFEKGVLTLQADNALWLNQLRFCIPELRDDLRTQGKLPQLSAIKLVVAADYHSETSNSTANEANLKKKPSPTGLQTPRGQTSSRLDKAMQKLAQSISSDTNKA